MKRKNIIMPNLQTKDLFEKLSPHEFMKGKVQSDQFLYKFH